MQFLLRLFSRLYLLALRTRDREELASHTPPSASPFRADTNYPFY